MSRDVAGFFDAQAERYDRVFEESGAAGRVIRARLALTLRLLDDSAGSVLDAGMAAGRLSAELAARGWSVAGIDVSPRMVELATRRVPGLDARQARLEALPFPDRSFDAVVATGVLEYTDDLGVALSEVERVLKPGGRAVVSFPYYRAPNNIWRRKIVYPGMRAVKRLVPLGRPAPQRRRHSVSLPRFEATVTAAGLLVETAERVGATPSPGRLRTRQMVYALTKPA